MKKERRCNLCTSVILTNAQQAVNSRSSACTSMSQAHSWPAVSHLTAWKNTVFNERPQYSPSEQPVTNQTDQLPQLEACSVEVGTKPQDWQSTPSLLGRRGERKQAIHHFVPKFTHPPVQRKKANPRQVIIIFFPLRLVPSL